MKTALYINGIFNGVLTEILKAQDERGGGNSYLQPYKGQVISMLRELNPSPSAPIRLYLSTTDNLSLVSYTGEIVGWEDKRNLAEWRRNEILQHLSEFQIGEVNLFKAVGKVGERAVNLIAIRSLQLIRPFPTNLLRKVSDGLPLKKRTRAGGWSQVFEDPMDLPFDTQDRYEEKLAEAVAESSMLSESALKERLASAPEVPEKVQIISTGYRRNPDVIVSVLRRADGFCERCGQKAPFLRRTDGSPYLEVHHTRPLSQGGKDTTDNATALCPNCHREVHHGPIENVN